MIPLIKARPPRLSQALDQLRALEDSGIFSNFGPVNKQFEADLTRQMFGGTGACLTVCNATLGLMLAIRQAAEKRTPRQVYALMPSFTFAAAAHAADWCGLKPLFCDIDPETWALDLDCVEHLLWQHYGEVAVIVPYATFGYDIDLAHYARLQEHYGIPVVVDAAASLGTIASDGHGFGTGFPGAVVFSMHATKSFSTGEGGVIHSADTALIGRLRTMCNFGFGQPRTATMPGLNAKLSELCALMAHLRLQDFGGVMDSRAMLMQRYRDRLPELTFQAPSARLQAHQFAPALLPDTAATQRDEVLLHLKERGIGAATYFSPHVAEQPYFEQAAGIGGLDVTQSVASRIISLPLFDDMTVAEVDEVCDALTDILDRLGCESSVSPAAFLPDMPDADIAPVEILSAAAATAWNLTAADSAD